MSERKNNDFLTILAFLAVGGWAVSAVFRIAKWILSPVPQVKQRTVDGIPVEYKHIAVMTPIMTESEMFQQIWCEYAPDFYSFKAAAIPLIERAKRGEPKPMTGHGQDFFCASCLPWLHFDSITQADYEFEQSVPILAWGKLKDGKIPISVKFNHCFMDGLHVASFFDRIQYGFSAPDTLWTNSEVDCHAE